MQKSRVALKRLESVPTFHSFANLFSQHVLQEHRLLFFLFILPHRTWEEIMQAFYQTELPSLLHLTGAGLCSPKDSRDGHKVVAWPWGHLESSLMVCLHEPSARALGTVPVSSVPGGRGSPAPSPWPFPVQKGHRWAVSLYQGCQTTVGMPATCTYTLSQLPTAVSPLTQKAEHRSVTVSGVLLWIAASCNLLFSPILQCTFARQGSNSTTAHLSSKLSDFPFIASTAPRISHALPVLTPSCPGLH